MKNFLRILVFCILSTFSALSLTGCTGGSGGGPWRYDPGIPAQVTGVQAESGKNLVTVSWKGSPLATSYNIYYISELSATGVSKVNGIKIPINKTSYAVNGLANNIKYFFIVTALNRDGESVESVQVSATPRPISNEDLVGTWYFHTLVTGPDARWERGTIDMALNNNNGCDAVISDFEDSSGHTISNPPSVFTANFTVSVNADGLLMQAGNADWVKFHGTMGSRKKMMVATFSTSTSCAIMILQKKSASDNYQIEDISGTGQGQNTNNPELLAHGPTRFAYHQLYSGSNTEWEYSNAKVGQKGKVLTRYCDIIYWDYSTPTYKGLSFDYFWKATSFSVDPDGLVKEHWNFPNVAGNPVPNFNYLVPKNPYDVVFTGRMTGDKTVVVGVTTRTDINGQNPQYFLRIMELCFIPTDQTLPVPGLTDLSGSFNFHKLGFNKSTASPSWAYGTMVITGSGLTTFPQYTDSMGNIQLSDSFTLSYYPDPNPDKMDPVTGKSLYTDFANFTTPARDGGSYYYDANHNPLHTYWDFSSTSKPASPGNNPSVLVDINNPATWWLENISPYYYNEHGSLSYNEDLFVMTRTDSSGYSILIGLM